MANPLFIDLLSSMSLTHLGDPGRPRTVVRRRSARMQARIAAYNEEAQRFAAEDRLTQAVCSNDKLETLYMSREEIAREAAGLLFDRLHTAPGSREVGRLASRRLAALREVSNLTLAIARANADAPSPDRMHRILSLLMETIDDAADGVLPPEDAEKFRDLWRSRIEPQLSRFASY